VCGNEGALATHVTAKHPEDGAGSMLRFVTTNATSKVCFSKFMSLAWEHWLAKMLSPEKINPMCAAIYLKRHVKAEEDIFFIASMITRVKQIMGGYFLSCVYDSLRLWKIVLSTKFIAARKLNNNQPRILPANYLLGQGRETRYK